MTLDTCHSINLHVFSYYECNNALITTSLHTYTIVILIINEK